MDIKRYGASVAIAVGLVILGVIAFFFFSNRSLGVPSSQAWRDLKYDAGVIAFADGLHCDPDQIIGPMRTAEAERKLDSLRRRYTLSVDQNAQLDSILTDAHSVSSYLAQGGATPENCFEAKQLVDVVINKMDSAD